MEMETKLSELYNELAQTIDSMIPTEWVQLYFLGEVEKNRASCGNVFYFTTSDSDSFKCSYNIPELYDVSEDICDELIYDLSRTVVKIYDCFLEYQQPPWEQMSLSLSSDGKFKIDYNYDVMHENDGGPSGREAVWAYETFGYIPADGSYSKEIFDKYVAKK